MLFNLLIDAFPEGVQLPKNIYETKKVILQLELSYDRIDACPNDCMLYQKNTAGRDSCLKCGAPRWKTVEGDFNDSTK